MSGFAVLLRGLLEGRPLTRIEAKRAMGEVMKGAVTAGQLGAFLGALRVRGETEDELIGFASALRADAIRVRIRREPLLDTCGTGGDGSGTFNISTTVAFIAAGAGAAVAKHGNRSVSSRCGSADVLEALGVRAEIPPERMARCVEEAGVGFLFAPALHPALRHAGPVRRELGARTVFNLLGPLANPAGARRQLLGVFDARFVAPLAGALKALGSESAVVVSSRDGLDEFSLGAAAELCRLSGGKLRRSSLDPRSLGFKRVPKSALGGGSAEDNARILLSVLGGEQGPARDVCLLNGAAALLVAGLARDMREGLARSAESIDSGRARAALEALRRLSRDGG